jgi:hypothetical protein
MEVHELLQREVMLEEKLTETTAAQKRVVSNQQEFYSSYQEQNLQLNALCQELHAQVSNLRNILWQQTISSTDVNSILQTVQKCQEHIIQTELYLHEIKSILSLGGYELRYE